MNSPSENKIAVGNATSAQNVSQKNICTNHTRNYFVFEKPSINSAIKEIAHIAEEHSPKSGGILTKTPEPTVITPEVQSPKCESDHKVILEEMQVCYKDWYKNIKLPIESWMEGNKSLWIKHYYFTPELSSTIDLEENTMDLENENNIELEKIFPLKNNGSGVRILVEGQPGYGKSTFTAKIANDWASSEDYVSQFRLVCLMTRENLNGKNLFEAVASDARQKNDEVLMDIINNEQTLLIIDGLDELDTETRKSVLEVLHNKVLYKMAIIATCKAGLFKLMDNEQKLLYTGLSMSHDFWDRKITICGIKREDRNEFLRKFTSDVNQEKLVQRRVSEMSVSMQDATASPLLLILLAFVMSKKNRPDITIKTDLFKRLIKYVIKRHGNRQEKSLCKHFDLCNLSDLDDQSIQTLLMKFGEIAIPHVLDNNLKFTGSDVIKEIYNLGFLTKVESKEIFFVNAQYECFHSSFLEFCVAFSFWMNYKKHRCFKSKAIKKINEIYMRKGEGSLVIPFLCGFLGNDVKDLIVQLEPYCVLYATNDNALELMLYECNIQSIVKFLAKMYPQEIVVANTTPLLISETVIENKAIQKKLQKLVIRSDQLWNAPKKLDVKMLRIRVSMNVPSSAKAEDIHYKFHKVRCEKLTIEFPIASIECADMEVCLKLLTIISSKYKKLSFATDVMYSHFLDSKEFHTVKVDELQCVLTHNECSKKMVLNVIHNNNANKVTLVVQSPEFLNEVVVAAAASNLKSIAIIGKGDKVCIDMDKLIRNGEKMWDALMLFKVDIACFSPPANVKRVASLAINHCKSNDKALLLLSSLAPKVLDVDVSLFNLMLSQNKLQCWDGRFTISQLMLNVRNDDKSFDCFSHLGELKHLKSFDILISERLTDQEEDFILKSLQSLKICRLGIQWDDCLQYAPRMVKKFERLKMLLKRLKSLDIIVLSYDINHDTSYSEVMKILLKFVRHRELTRLNIVSDAMSTLHSLLKLGVINFSKFKIEHTADHSYKMGNDAYDSVIETYHTLRIQNTNCRKVRWEYRVDAAPRVTYCTLLLVLTYVLFYWVYT